MSEYHVNSANQPPPPDVPIEFDTDINSPAIPALNILEVFGGSISDDNDFGIQTDGSSGGNTLTIQLTNRGYGTTQTVGAVVDDINLYSLVPPGAGTFKIVIEVAAYNESDANSGAAYTIEGCVVSDGLGALNLVGSATIVMIGDITVFSTTLVDVNILAGVLRVEVTGVAGKTIDWKAYSRYLFGGP